MKTTALPVLFAGLAFIPLVGANEPSANLQLARQLNQAFIEVAEKVSPAVVVIDVVQKPPDPDSFDEAGGRYDPPREFRRRFQPQPFEEPETGQGSGVIIREDGYILTNGHVVDDAEKIEVRLHDGRTFTAKVRGVDPQSDIAVIKIEATGLPIATLADSAKTRVGEFAIAIGAPFSFDYSVTYGHVSAKGRQNVIRGRAGEALDQDFIQTDANINPGNSGGPLVNIEGEVIGINALIRGLHTGIGFAIPSGLAREVSDRLIADGKFTRAWLGIRIRASRDYPEFHERFQGVEEGVVVDTIEPDGPSYNSELKLTDVITAVDGKHVSTPQELKGEIRGKRIGQPVTLDVFRGGKTVQIKVKPAEWVDPLATVLSVARNTTPTGDSTGLGLTVHVLTRELAKQFGVEMTQGLIVLSVDKGTPADQQRIEPGDVITAVDHQPVANSKQFHDALKRSDLKKGVVLNLLSGKKAHFEILKEKS